jgi:hypothetical protein
MRHFPALDLDMRNQEDSHEAALRRAAMLEWQFRDSARNWCGRLTPERLSREARDWLIWKRELFEPFEPRFDDIFRPRNSLLVAAGDIAPTASC